MAHAEQSVTVERPIGDVFAFPADGLNNRRWRPEVSKVMAGPARPTGSFSIREVGASTTQGGLTLDLKPKRLMVLMTPVTNKQVKVEVGNIDNLPSATAP